MEEGEQIALIIHIIGTVTGIYTMTWVTTEAPLGLMILAYVATCANMYRAKEIIRENKKKEEDRNENI